MPRRLLVTTLLLLACGSDMPAPTVDGATLADGGSAALWSGPVTLPVDGTIHWADGDRAQGPLAAVNLDGNVGSIVFHGATLPAAISEEIPFGAYDLAQIVASSSDEIVVVYAYCQSGSVSDFYYESLSDQVTPQGAVTVGNCALPKTATTSTMAFEQFAMPPADVLHVTQASTMGAVSLLAGVGSAQLGDGSWDVLAFDWVDCSTRCGTPGWYEMHSLLRRDQQVAFGIFYLITNAPSTVQLDHGWRFDVPSAAPPNQVLSATWTIN